MPKAPGRKIDGGKGSSAAPAAAAPSLLVRALPWIVLLGAIALSAYVRLRLAEIALERDEGEYAYAGRLILEGVPPYKLAYNMKPPGIYAAYAAIMAILGQTPFGIRLGLLLVHSASAVLVFLIGRRLLDPLSGAIAGGAYALLATSTSVLGLFAHASHFIVLPALAGLLFIRIAIDSGSWPALLGAGGLLGLSVLMKQHAVFLLAFGALDLLWAQYVEKVYRPARPWIAWAAFAAGAALPYVVTVLILLGAGTFDRFWFWTVSYAREYVSEVSLAKAVPFFFSAVSGAIGSSVVIWLLAALGLAASWFDASLKRARAFLHFFLLFSFLAVCPGFYFREHYFIVMLPGVALAAGAGACWIARRLFGRSDALPASLAAAAILVIAGGVLVQGQRAVFFDLGLNQASRTIYGANPFPEAIEVGRYLAARTTPNETIAVLGSEPQIYFYSGRRSATGYIYTYGLMEPQPFASRMQDEMIGEIEAAQPAYLVMINVRTSWLVRKTSDLKILRWAEAYSGEHYDLVGMADIQSERWTEYRWDDRVAGYQPQGENYISIFRRRGPPKAAGHPTGQG